MQTDTMEAQTQANIQPQTNTPQPQAPVQAFTPVAAPPTGARPKGIPPVVWILILLILFAAAFAGGFLLRTKKEESAAPAGPTPTLVPTETPVHRKMNPIATSSAYLNLEGYVASLSASLSGYQVENQTVAPPVLDLPLGFTGE